MTSYDKDNRKPKIWELASYVVSLGIFVRIGADLTADYWREGHWLDLLGIIAFSGLFVLNTVFIIDWVLKRRSPRDTEIDCRGCEGLGILPDGMCWECQGTGRTVHRV